MVGKCIANRIYVHSSLFPELNNELRTAVENAMDISRLTADEHFNVARIDLVREEVGLLSYPEFLSEPFPALATSWRVHLPSKSTTYRDYRSSLNPPVLHRKELLLPAAHPERPAFEARTKFAESIGLFNDPVRIGFRKQWEELVASKGYCIIDGQFAPVANDGLSTEEVQQTAFTGNVERYRTALSRQFLSAPVQALLRHRVLDTGRTFFDYGCGRGDDLAGLLSLGYAASGWDPHFRPESPLQKCDVVNLGFVINVIEDIDERIAALKGAYELATGALAVGAILWSSSTARGRPYGDGVLTSRNTFQRFFNQGELQTFIEGVLDEQAFPVAPGIYFVFPDRYMEQRFLSGRQRDPTRAPRLLAARERSTLSAELRRQKRAEASAIHSSALANLWNTTIELGRLPEPDEHFSPDTIIELFGSWKRALNRMLAAYDSELLQKAASARMEELRLFFAMQAFERRRNRVLVDPRLRRDVRAFFGSLSAAESEGLQLLKRSADTAQINSACDAAAAEGLGWLDGDHSLQLHTSMVRQLPAVLRAYIGCATSLYGDVSSTDLIKIHIQSGKVSLMKFDDFEGSAVPCMLERVKIKLREQDLDLFEYQGEFQPTPLYFKSRYINEEFPSFSEQLEFDTTLEELGIVDKVGFGPTYVEFLERLRRSRWEIIGLQLQRSTDVPSLDERCGKTFRYCQLIECGETWERTKVENTPHLAESFNALYDLATRVLDPIVEYFGAIKLTYGFAGPPLTRQISGGIAPTLDQHAASEANARGRRICSRGGAAVDFLVEYEDMREVADWIADHLPYDRLYYYGPNRPIHVSFGPEHSRSYIDIEEREGRRLPRPARPRSSR
jgi:DNA phosphorothioation-associated putative methyltransferase